MWRWWWHAPCFSIQSSGHCVNFLKTSRFAYCMESSLSRKPALCIVMWFHHWIVRNTMCFSAYSALWESWFGRHNRRDFNLQWRLFMSDAGGFYKHQIKIKIRSERLLSDVRIRFIGIRQKVGKKRAFVSSERDWPWIFIRYFRSICSPLKIHWKSIPGKWDLFFFFFFFFFFDILKRLNLD